VAGEAQLGRAKVVRKVAHVERPTASLGPSAFLESRMWVFWLVRSTSTQLPCELEL
jgi:hypothetical protein